MPSREHIFNSIRKNLGEPMANDASIEAAYHQLTPHVLRAKADNLVDAFQLELESLSGQVTRVKHAEDIVTLAVNALKNHKTKTLLVSNTDACKQLPWPKDIIIEHRKAEDGDKVSLSDAYAGVAETGSIVLCSSARTPTTHNFLVDDHMVILPASKIVAHLEEVWEQLDKQNMPRTVNVLTGPSRTGDVEQTIQIGAHGPLRFHVFIVENE